MLIAMGTGLGWFMKPSSRVPPAFIFHEISKGEAFFSYKKRNLRSASRNAFSLIGKCGEERVRLSKKATCPTILLLRGLFQMWPTPSLAKA
jgi:hypothetical protein